MKGSRVRDSILSFILLIFSIAFLAPIFVVLMNSFKGKFFISESPFVLPNADTFVGISNYMTGITKTGFLQAFGWSLFITVSSVLV
ncbi:MAG TPA: carbohydrate ABC transporter permease, partial [Negativicutes bacterium]|nr:carbohydrate ABC transporter permease [Negativicutes bacterium]